MNQLLINSRDGGISDGDLVGTDNSFASLKNIDYQRKPGAIRLSATNTRLFATDGVLNAVAGMFRFSDNGKIYDSAGNVKYTMPTYPSRIYNAIYFAGYYYWIADQNLHRISLGNANVGGTWTSVQLNYKVLGNNNTYPMINVYNKLLYIGIDNVLKRLDIDGNLSAGITFDGTIVGLTFVGDNIKVYTRGTAGSKVYMVVPIEDESYGLMDMKGNYTRSVINSGSSDYMLVGSAYNKHSGAIYLQNGYDAEMFQKSFKRDNLFQFVGNIQTGETGIMTKYKDMLLVGSREGIYSIGNYYPGGQQTANFDFVLPNDNIGLLYTDLDTLYISYKSGDGCYLDQIDLSQEPTGFMSDGEIISRIYSGDSMCNIKTVRQISLAFERLNAGESIELYLKKNGESQRGDSLITLDYDNTRDTNFKKFVGPDIDIGEWNYIQIKIVLKSGLSKATSPTLYEFQLLYDEK